VVDLLIIQGSPFCNIACKYCYLPDRHITKKIALPVIEKTFYRLQESNLLGKEVTVVWHAGEPLTVPLTYYESIFETIKSHSPSGTIVSHAIQTNATLINDDWCLFFKKNNIRVGVSIDGPVFVHDRFRVKRNGNGTFSDTMKGIDFLKKHQIDFHVISVLTDFSLDYPDEIFQFFIDLGVQRLGFNVEETEGINQTSTINGQSHTRVHAFLKNIFALQKASRGKIIIREFESAFRKIVGNPMLPHNTIDKTIPTSHLIVPYGIISVDCDGNFMTFSPELLGQKSEEYGPFILGNVLEDSFKVVSESQKFKAIHNDILSCIRMCNESCAYFKVCGGGAPSNKFYENNSFKSTETNFCRFSIQAPIDIVLEDLEQSITA
jgi:uncharacterized protein